MARHDELYPLVLLEAPGCPLPIMNMAINRAAREFCEKSRVWQEWLDDVTASPGVYRYDIDVPRDSSVVVLNTVRCGRRALTPEHDNRASRQWGVVDGEPLAYAVTPGRAEIIIDPVPVAVETISINAALQPTLTAAALPDVVVQFHFEAVAEGAKAILKRMPNRPWSDPAGAAIAEQIFSQKAAEARIEAEYGRVVGSMRATPRAFGQ